MTCLELRRLLRECGLIIRGRKAELIARLKDNKKTGVPSTDPTDDTEERKKGRTMEKEIESEKSTLKLGKRRIILTKEDNAANRSNKKLRSSGESDHSASSINSKRRMVSTKEENAIKRSKKKLRSA